ncbi:MAG: GspH/FimT family pseudopilin, partial [Nitrosomonadales bacterium]|nr:GspH/FimT family pseudopilin [Nitrosomonadales bacterium]
MLIKVPVLKERGFSLVELLVAIALIGILGALGTSSYTQWIQNTRIRTVAESIQNGLQIARAEAIKRNARVQFVLGANSSWTVGCTVVVADLDGDGVADCPAVIQSRSVGEGGSTNITIAPTPAGSSTVIFSSLGSVLSPPAVAAAPFSRVEVDISPALLAA